jgi:hypothetical protein
VNICDKHGTQYLIVCKLCLRESGGKEAMVKEQKEIIDHFTDEMNHNLKWAEIERDTDHPFAAERRVEHAEKLRRWIEWLSSDR